MRCAGNPFHPATSTLSLEDTRSWRPRFTRARLSPRNTRQGWEIAQRSCSGRGCGFATERPRPLTRQRRRTMDRIGSFSFLVLTLVIAGCSSAILTRIPVASASATLTTVNGTAAGTVQLRQAAGGMVTVDVNAIGLTPGAHGIHFHEVGQCEGAS